MQANVIHTGSLDSFDYLVSPEQNPMNQSYIVRQFENMSNTLTDIGRQFMASSRAMYEKFNDSTAMRTAKAALRMAKGMVHPNTVVELNTIEQLQAAHPLMQRYIMAEPTIRALYMEQKCDGYSDTYVNVYGNDIGAGHYDYRRVMSNVIESTKDDNWVARIYEEDLNAGDRDLTHDEKVDILNTWEEVRRYIIAGQDPTSIYGSEIGI